MSQADAIAEAIRTHLVGSSVAVCIFGLWTGGKHLDRSDRLDDVTVIGDALLLEFANQMNLVLRAPGEVSFESGVYGRLSMVRIGSVGSVTWTRYLAGGAPSAATLHQTDYVLVGDVVEVTRRSAGRAVAGRHRGSRSVEFYV